MATNFNLNKAMKDRTFRVVAIIAVLAILFFVGYLIFNGAHNKLPGGIETNIPKESENVKQKQTDNVNQIPSENVNQKIEIHEMKGGEVNMNKKVYYVDSLKKD